MYDLEPSLYDCNLHSMMLFLRKVRSIVGLYFNSQRSQLPTCIGSSVCGSFRSHECFPLLMSCVGISSCVLVIRRLKSNGLALVWRVIGPAKTWITKLVSVPSRSSLVFVSASILPSNSLLCNFALNLYHFYQPCIFISCQLWYYFHQTHIRNGIRPCGPRDLHGLPKDCVGLTGFWYLFR